MILKTWRRNCACVPSNPLQATLFVLGVGFSFGAIAQSMQMAIERNDANPAATRDLQSIRNAVGASVVRTLPGAQTEVWQVNQERVQDLRQLVGAQARLSSIRIDELPGAYTSLLAPAKPTRDLTPGQAALYGRIREANGRSEVHMVELAAEPVSRFALTQGFGKTDGFSKPGSFDVRITSSQRITVSRDSSRFADSSLVWRGTSQQNGEVHLLVRGRDITGTIQEPERIISIRPIGDGLHAVVATPRTAFPAEHPPRMQKQTYDRPPPQRDVKPPQADDLVLDVLVAHTEGASAQYLNIERDLIELAISETNEGLRQSGLSRIRVRLVGTSKVQYQESGIWDEYLNHLVSPKDGMMDELHFLRDKLRADIVVLLINDRQYCGEARDILAEEHNAFAVVHHGCAAGYYSFGHEIGHLLGARHDYATDSSDDPFPFGHGHVAKACRTIMAYGDSCGSCPRKNQWSGPHLKLCGEVGGTLAREHDAAVWQQTAPIAMRFR